MDDVPTPQAPGWFEPSGVTHVSLTPAADTDPMDLLTALAWAEQRNAVLRFNNNEQDGEHSVRVTVCAHNPGDRIVAVHQVPDGVPVTEVLARAIGEVREHWEATDPRNRLRLIPAERPPVADDAGVEWDQLYDNQPAGWERRGPDLPS